MGATANDLIPTVVVTGMKLKLPPSLQSTKFVVMRDWDMIQTQPTSRLPNPIPPYQDLELSRAVVVPGGSGYIATEVVKQLLEGGYNVRATVRSKKNLTKVQHLLDFAACLPGSLSLHEVRHL